MLGLSQCGPDTERVTVYNRARHGTFPLRAGDSTLQSASMDVSLRASQGTSFYFEFQDRVQTT